VAVSSADSWADAAATVGVSPSALSQGLSELERRVGVPLFDRDGRRRVMRPSAEPVLAHARQVVALTGDLAEWAERTRSGDSGQLRIGMMDAAALGHYPDVLRQFRDDHPDLDLTLRVAPSAQLLDEVEAGTLELAVVVEGPARRGVQTEPLIDEALAVFTPSGSLPRDPQKWGPWVLFTESSHTRQVAEAALIELGAARTIVAESNQPDVLRAMVDLGVGSTVLPLVQASPGAGPGKVIATRRLMLATRTGAATSPMADAFAAALRA